MDIESGGRIILQLSTFEDRFLGVVAGIRNDGRFMAFVTMPRAARDRLRVDDSAAVKYAYDGRLLGFSTRVLKVVDHEDTLLELEGPGVIFDAEERAEPRCACRYPATMSLNGQTVRGVVEDMSASCARLRLLDDWAGGFSAERGDSLTLTFHPFEMSANDYSIGCSVVKLFMKNGERYAVLRFDTGETDMLERISGFIEAQVCCALSLM
ncbi:MAG: PilZ domain-containing protein [Desulfovibrionaceae bacterium]|nr:PilZ domain-containing protein [Desulfovibrionaceae bacterium]